MGEVIRLALAIAAKDLRGELRTKTSLVSALAFAALVLVIFNFARDPTVLTAQLLAPSALWITCTFAAMTTLNRAFALEREHGAMDGLLLAPVPREALFLGKWLGNLGFVALVEAVAVPLFVLFFNVDVGPVLGAIVLLLALATAGFTAVGTIFAAMAVKTRFAELMLPLLLLPFMVPPLVGAAQVTSRLLAGRPLTESADWLRLLTVYDIVFVTIGLLAFGALLDE